MTRLFVALVLSLSLATAAYAAQFTVVGCTQDKQIVSTEVDVNDSLAAAHPVVEHIKTAFAAAAAQLTATAFKSETGFFAFVSGLDDTDIAAINTLNLPSVTGTCQ